MPSWPFFSQCPAGIWHHQLLLLVTVLLLDFELAHSAGVAQFEHTQAETTNSMYGAMPWEATAAEARRREEELEELKRKIALLEADARDAQLLPIAAPLQQQRPGKMTQQAETPLQQQRPGKMTQQAESEPKRTQEGLQLLTGSRWPQRSQQDLARAHYTDAVPPLSLLMEKRAFLGSTATPDASLGSTATPDQGDDERGASLGSAVAPDESDDDEDKCGDGTPFPCNIYIMVFTFGYAMPMWMALMHWIILMLLTISFCCCCCQLMLRPLLSPRT